MNKLSQVLLVVGAVVAVVALGLLGGWLGTRRASKPAAPVVVSPGPTNGDSAATLPPQPVPSVPASNPAPVVATPAEPPGPPPATNWEDRVDAVLGSTVSDREKSKALLAMFPRLSEEGQVEVAQHLSNLTPDEDFQSLKPYLTNSTLAEPVMDALMAGLLNRPNSLKLPMLLDMARTEDHPKAAEAKDLLTLFLDEDDGKDWTKWESRLQQWLKDNPD